MKDVTVTIVKKTYPDRSYLHTSVHRSLAEVAMFSSDWNLPFWWLTSYLSALIIIPSLGNIHREAIHSLLIHVMQARVSKHLENANLTLHLTNFKFILSQNLVALFYTLYRLRKYWNIVRIPIASPPSGLPGFDDVLYPMKSM